MRQRARAYAWATAPLVHLAQFVIRFFQGKEDEPQVNTDRTGLNLIRLSAPCNPSLSVADWFPRLGLLPEAENML